MLRVTLGVIGGFIAWLFLWVGTEMVLSLAWPDWFGAHQRAFTAAIKNGGPFSADTTILLMQIVLPSIVTLASGLVAALIARQHHRAPLILGLLLSAFGLLKVMMSWPYVPIWHHVVFMALLMPMAIFGGKLAGAARK